MFPMSMIDEVLSANREYAKTHEQRHMSPRPRRRLCVVTCMDTRLTLRSLGLTDGDAHVLRNAGGIVTDDVIRSVVISHHLLGTQEVMLINHTNCGLLDRDDDELRQLVVRAAGAEADSPSRFHTFRDVDANVREQLARLRAHPWTRHLPVRGFVYEVESGRLREVPA